MRMIEVPHPQNGMKAAGDANPRRPGTFSGFDEVAHHGLVTRIVVKASP